MTVFLITPLISGRNVGSVPWKYLLNKGVDFALAISTCIFLTGSRKLGFFFVVVGKATSTSSHPSNVKRLFPWLGLVLFPFILNPNLRKTIQREPSMFPALVLFLALLHMRLC